MSNSYEWSIKLNYTGWDLPSTQSITMSIDMLDINHGLIENLLPNHNWIKHPCTNAFHPFNKLLSCPWLHTTNTKNIPNSQHTNWYLLSAWDLSADKDILVQQVVSDRIVEAKEGVLVIKVGTWTFDGMNRRILVQVLRCHIKGLVLDNGSLSTVHNDWVEHFGLGDRDFRVTTVEQSKQGQSLLVSELDETRRGGLDHSVLEDLAQLAVLVFKVLPLGGVQEVSKLIEWYIWTGTLDLGHESRHRHLCEG